MKSSLIAPCGMNCNLCIAQLREKNPCPGCRASDKDKPKTRTGCFIKNCNISRNQKYCSKKCEKYPCIKLKNLDKRYRTKYSMSMIENLEFLSQNGIRDFIRNEEHKWIKDDKVFCVHNRKYYGI